MFTGFLDYSLYYLWSEDLTCWSSRELTLKWIQSKFDPLPFTSFTSVEFIRRFIWQIQCFPVLFHVLCLIWKPWHSGFLKQMSRHSILLKTRFFESFILAFGGDRPYCWRVCNICWKVTKEFWHDSHTTWIFETKQATIKALAKCSFIILAFRLSSSLWITPNLTVPFWLRKRISLLNNC